MPSRPQAGEYADYYHQYISKVPEGDIFEILERQMEETTGILAGVSAEKAAYRYAPEKWSLKQVVGHVCDVERLFSYRAMVFARGDKTPLPSFEQDDYAAGANFDERELPDLVDELRAIRGATLALFRSLDESHFTRKGKASGFDFTVRAVLYIIAGHERHHIGVIKERYL